MGEEPILLKDEVEANLMDSILNEEGIPHFLKQYAMPAYDGIKTYKDCWGHIDAPKQYLPGIRTILKEMRESKKRRSG